MTTAETPKLYKVLLNGASCHGGSLQWPLPTKNEDGTWIPGAWTEVTGPLALCENGLYLASQPTMWYVEGSTLYAAEYDGDLVGDTVSDKVCVRRVRLVSEALWADHGVYHAGEHSLFGNATATLFDNATATLSGNATAISTPWHSESAQVTLSQMAAHVDRRNGKLVFHSAEMSMP